MEKGSSGKWDGDGGKCGKWDGSIKLIWTAEMGSGLVS